MKLKILSVVGTRPEFIRAHAMSRALRERHCEILLNTGQHYDHEMSSIFFEELGVPPPEISLGIGSDTHGAQTGALLTAIERVLLGERPDVVVVHGDTNSTLAGALAAVKLHIPVVHVEAGLRSFNKLMPEEINRIVVDHVSSLWLCPSEIAAENLRREGIVENVRIVGDLMADALHLASARAKLTSRILTQLGLSPQRFLLATVHRAENTDDLDRLSQILEAFIEVDEEIVFPVHPRTRHRMTLIGDELLNRVNESRIRLVDPLGYLDMLMLEQSARMILTDSGGIQKEAYWLGVPCITLRDETEWVETVINGWNVLVGANKEQIISAVKTFVPQPFRSPLYQSDGDTAARCVVEIERFMSVRLRR